MSRSALRTAALIALALALSACSTTRFTSAWRDPAYAGPPMKKIVVIGVSEEVAARRVFEDGFAQALTAAGVEALPGYRLLPEKPDRPAEQLKEAVAKVGADGVLVARALRTEKRTEYTPGHITVMPSFGYGNFWGFYGAHAVVTEPRAYEVQVVTIETNLWPARDGHVLWSALSESTDPSEVARLTKDLSELVIKALREQKLIAPAPAR